MQLFAFQVTACLERGIKITCLSSWAVKTYMQSARLCHSACAILCNAFGALPPTVMEPGRHCQSKGLQQFWSPWTSPLSLLKMGLSIQQAATETVLIVGSAASLTWQSLVCEVHYYLTFSYPRKVKLFDPHTVERWGEVPCVNQIFIKDKAILYMPRTQTIFHQLLYQFPLIHNYSL